MDDFISLFTFAIDFVCAMPRLNDIDELWIPREYAVATHCGALAMLFIATILSEKGGAILFLGFLCCSLLICLVSGPAVVLGWNLILLSFPTTVGTIRVAEGFPIGLTVRKRFGLWGGALIVPLVLGLAAAVFFGLSALPEVPVSAGTIAWAVFIAIAAAFSWIRMLEMPVVSFQTIAWFAIFLSLYLYVPLSMFHIVLFQWAFPAGFLVGFFWGKKLENYAVRQWYGRADADKFTDEELQKLEQIMSGRTTEDDRK